MQAVKFILTSLRLFDGHSSHQNLPKSFRTYGTIDTCRTLLETVRVEELHPVPPKNKIHHFGPTIKAQ